MPSLATLLSSLAQQADLLASRDPEVALRFQDYMLDKLREKHRANTSKLIAASESHSGDDGGLSSERLRIAEKIALIAVRGAIPPGFPDSSIMGKMTFGEKISQLLRY